MSKPGDQPRRKRVPVHGVLLLDKPVGLSSNQALIQAKRLLNAEKAGHTGTLDPFATGLLPLCFGEATKFSQDLLDADKTYETTVRLGVQTDTGDTEGDVVSERPVNCSREQIEAVLAGFRGVIEQVPPMYSALKRDGKPLYEYARAGITVERQSRTLCIHRLELQDWQAPLLKLLVRCSKGTYIRVLGEDIGNALACGAHLQQLRRTEVGSLTLAGAVTLEAFAAMSPEQRLAALAPADALLASFPALRLDAVLSARFLQGQRLALSEEQAERPLQSARVRVYSQEGHFLGSAHLHPYGVLAPERLIARGSLPA
ncbi:MAG: tRNA pseudouridine(55) synthase TruB [Lacisediminimonas sp.]|nr:tRNA pseudouridine(55) synthase TruB [Lacisediminimonas sp.]